MGTPTDATAGTAAPPSPLGGDRSLVPGYDEMLAPTGQPRAHWQTLMASLDRLGRDELGVRGENSRRILAEHGVTCFVNRNGSGTDEPWQLDLMPLVIGCEEWRALEAGLIQRARLLNLFLGDLYGTQRLVRDGDQHRAAFRRQGRARDAFKAWRNGGCACAGRFVVQPSFQQYAWSEEKKAKLQAFVEKLHAYWPMDRDPMAPRTRGTLVTLDPALLLTPPKGLEAGYVPIVTRQAARLHP